MKQTEIRDKLSDGWVQGIVTFEVAGKPKAHVEQSLQKYVDNVKKDERVAVIHEDPEEAAEHEDGVFSAFSEVEMLVKNLEVFSWIAINFSPASIEIIEPTEMYLESREMTNWLNDLLAKVHDVASEHRQVLGANKHMTIALNQLIKNATFLSLREGPKSIDEIKKDTGVAGEQLKPFLEDMIKRSKLVQVEEKYQLP